MSYAPVSGNYHLPYQDPAFQNQQVTLLLKKHQCRFCNYASDRAHDVKKHETRKHSNLSSHNGDKRKNIHQPDMHREVRDFQRNYNQSIDYNLQKADYEDTCDEGKSENNKKVIYLRILSCGNCRFKTSSVEEMTKHKQRDHGIIWCGKYSQTETGDLRTGFF